MTRREEREALFALLFEMSFCSEEERADLYRNECDWETLEENDYVATGYAGVLLNSDSIDEMISAASKGWKLSRLSKVTLAILRLGCYEFCYTDLPYSIAINEAVELAKKYDDDKAPKFVNGVLNKIAVNRGLKENADQSNG